MVQLVLGQESMKHLDINLKADYARRYSFKDWEPYAYWSTANMCFDDVHQ